MYIYICVYVFACVQRGKEREREKQNKMEAFFYCQASIYVFIDIIYKLPFTVVIKKESLKKETEQAK